MAQVTVLNVSINRIPGIVRGTTVTVTGSAECEIYTDPEGEPHSAISEVAVRVGSGQFVSAKPTGPTGPGQEEWSTWTTDPLPITGVVNDRLPITAWVSALTKRDMDTAIVTVDRTPPVLSLTTPRVMTQAVVDGKTTFQVAGAATDERSPVVAVEWALGQGQPTLGSGFLSKTLCINIQQ